MNEDVIPNYEVGKYYLLKDSAQTAMHLMAYDKSQIKYLVMEITGFVESEDFISETSVNVDWVDFHEIQELELTEIDKAYFMENYLCLTSVWDRYLTGTMNDLK